MDRILDIADRSLAIRVRNGCLVLLEEGKDVNAPIPLRELGALVVSNPQATFSRAVLSELAMAGVSVITCDDKSQPVSMLLPLKTHSTQSERMQAQLLLKLPRKKRMHQQLIKAKIRAQAEVLRLCSKQDYGLKLLAKTVRSGDPANVEARAARIYWKHVFSQPFRRDPDLTDANMMLNYGYAILRAMVGRALAGVGLHPGIGLFHHNKYNPFCLSDDMIEPFRPLIDLAVSRWLAVGEKPALNGFSKQKLLNPMLFRYLWNKEVRSLFDWLVVQARSLANVCMGKQQSLIIPFCVAEYHEQE